MVRLGSICWGDKVSSEKQLTLSEQSTKAEVHRW